MIRQDDKDRYEPSPDTDVLLGMVIMGLYAALLAVAAVML